MSRAPCVWGGMGVQWLWPGGSGQDAGEEGEVGVDVEGLEAAAHVVLPVDRPLPDVPHLHQPVRGPEGGGGREVRGESGGGRGHTTFGTGWMWDNPLLHKRSDNSHGCQRRGTGLEKSSS